MLSVATTARCQWCSTTGSLSPTQRYAVVRGAPVPAHAPGRRFYAPPPIRQQHRQGFNGTDEATNGKGTPAAGSRAKAIAAQTRSAKEKAKARNAKGEPKAKSPKGH